LSELSPAYPVDAVKARIREDIRAALRARNLREAGVLRTLLAALDNAEAHPVAGGHTPYVARTFGDKAVEVARKVLSAEEVDAVLHRECDEKLSVARQLDERGRAAEAADLTAEAAIVARYMRSKSD
jgi:uncharacterized protein YqeY